MTASSTDAPGEAAVPSSSTAPTPTSLLHDYDELLQAARNMSFEMRGPVAPGLLSATAASIRRLFVNVPSTHRRRGIRRWVHSLPRPRWFLRYFAVDHMRRTLDAIRRRLLARAALGHPDDDDVQRQAVTDYAESLPPQHRALYSTTLIAVTVVLARFLLLNVPGAARQFGGTGTVGEADVIARLLDAVGRTTAGTGSLDGLLSALASSPVRTTAFVATSLATVLYVELRWLVPAFRLKRMLWNLHPRTDLVPITPASWSVQRATGTYSCERKVARELGAPPPREVPFDLIVAMLALPCFAFLAGMFVEIGIADADQPGEPWLSFTIATAIVLAVAIRLGWLVRTWLRRLHTPEGTYLPSEARISGTDLVLALRDPRTIAWATTAASAICIAIGLTEANIDARTAGVFEPVNSGAIVFDRSRFLILALVIGPVWYRINRDVHAYLAVRGQAPRGWPVMSLLAMVLAGVPSTARPAFVVVGAALVATTVYRTCERVRRAGDLALCRPAPSPRANLAQDDLQARPLPSSASMVLRFLAFPVALAQIQRVINAVWACDGRVLDRPADLVDDA